MPSGAPTIEMREVLEGEEGCDVSMVAKVSGCPFPSLTWQRASIAKPEEKTSVQYDQHMNKLVTQDKCTLLIQQASRLDSALYSLTASNSLGTVTKNIKLLVLGKKTQKLCCVALANSLFSLLINLVPLSPHLLFASIRTTRSTCGAGEVHRGVCGKDRPGLEPSPR